MADRHERCPAAPGRSEAVDHALGIRAPTVAGATGSESSGELQAVGRPQSTSGEARAREQVDGPVFGGMAQCSHGRRHEIDHGHRFVPSCGWERDLIAEYRKIFGQRLRFLLSCNKAVV